MTYPGGVSPDQRSGSGPRGGGLRARLSRWATPQETLHAEHEQKQAARLGGTPVAELVPRRRAMVCGTLRSVTLRPRAGVPALVAELYDGSGTLAVVWLGRRQIAGVEPGRRLRVEGMVTQTDGRPMLFNPRYELVPSGG
jgi:hypothetical protein